MKTLSIGILFLALNTTVFAQYTKASFFTKPGRFYEASIGVLNFGTGIKPAAGFLFGFGKLGANGKTITASEVGLYNRTTFKLNGYDNLGNDVIVNGKSAPLLSFNYSVAFNLVKNDNEDGGKIIPYIKLSGLGIFQIGKEILASGNSTSYENLSKIGTFITGGVGGVYSLNRKLGIKLEGNYRYFVGTTGEMVDENIITFRSNISYNIGLRYSFGESE